ncbi:MAG: glycosyltransferase [Bacteroidetes bacterium]|nr:glycosyltransferase [Bacteroidota bacterium]MCW5896048.1 glycosyltransferase [Bacteroidota bacterium]
MTTTLSPLVSIVTPTFNSSQFIARTLKCIADQSYLHIEHIIIDGGSTDGTLDILGHQTRAKWISGPDNGMYDAINKGMKMATGEIVAYLNSDDLYFEDTVGRVVEFFDQNPDADLVYSDLLYIDENGESLFVRKYPPFAWRMFAVLDGSTIPQQTAFWRRRVLESAGYFDSTFKMAGDFEFFVRAGKNHNVRKLPGKPLAAFRFHEEMQTLNRKRINDEEIERIHRMYGFPPSVRNRLLKQIATLRYKMCNVHRVKDKTASLLSGNKPKYRP